MLVVGLVNGKVDVELDDVVDPLLPQDTSIRDGRMRTQIASRYNFIFTLSSLFTLITYSIMATKKTR
jgi:hypothetical protein